jgi:putative thioredoxin
VSNFNGAYDLSKLTKPAASSSAPKASVTVASLVTECTEQNLRDVLALSNEIPVILEFHADSIKPLEFSARLEKVVLAFEGRVVLARVDAQVEQRVSQAFAVKGAPTLLAVIKGQPVPLFEGDQDEQSTTKVIEQVLKVASENGLNSVAVVGDVTAAASAPVLAPLHQEAFDAIGRMDFDAAIAAYNRALAENPRDDLAVSGLAQVKLLQRTDGINPSSLPSSPPADLDELLQWADVMASIGDVASAFNAILDGFSSHPESKDRLRKHLVELFAVVEPDNADLLAARKRLASLLY